MLVPKILFFINESVPTESEKITSLKMEGKVCFRNARFVAKDGCLENCDFVFGAIPERYLVFSIFGVEIEKEVNGRNESNVKDVFPKASETKTENKEVKVVWKPNV